jgi:ERCC4-type nuclease
MLLDVRERDLCGIFPTESVKQLEVGDIWIGLSGETLLPGGLCIERKEVKDLEGSLKDGRYREQRTRLLYHCQQTKARPLYIIEGNLDAGWTTSKKVFQKVLSRLSLRYGIPFLQTKDIKDTAALLQALQEQYTEDPTVFIIPETNVPYTELVGNSKKANRNANAASAMLQQITGVSDTMATALLRKFGSFSKVYEASQKELAETKVSDKRKVGPAVAKRLWETFHSSE